jgi:hypothetical protein
MSNYRQLRNYFGRFDAAHGRAVNLPVMISLAFVGWG